MRQSGSNLPYNRQGHEEGHVFLSPQGLAEVHVLILPPPGHVISSFCFCSQTRSEEDEMNEAIR